MQTPLVRTALAFVAGILLGSLFLVLPWTAIILASLLIAAAAVLAFRARHRLPALLGALAAFAAGTALLLLSVLSRPPDHYLRHGLPDGRRHEAAGRIVSPLERDLDRTAFLLEVERIDGKAASGLLRVSVRDPGSSAGYGDHIIAAGKLYPPRGYRKDGRRSSSSVSGRPRRRPGARADRAASKGRPPRN